MAASFPTSTFNSSTPGPSSFQDDGGLFHDVLHTNEILEIIAIETYLGTNASQTTPTGSNRVLASTSSSASTWTGTPTLTTITVVTSVIYDGSSSGSTTVQASATASGTLTLPATTDTLVGKATTDTLTNKTFDTAGTGNVFKINGTSITAKTGTGNVVLSDSPTFTTKITGQVVDAPNLTSSAIFLGYSSVTSNQGSITAQVDLTSLSVAVTVPTFVGARAVKITANCNFTCNTVDGSTFLYIAEGASVLSTHGIGHPYSGGNQQTISGLAVVLVPTAGAHTYKLQASSSNTSTLVATSTAPAQILVELS